MPYTENAAFARIYGDNGTGVWLAPKGTTLPTGLDDPGVGFAAVGWLGDDGISLNIEKEVKKFNALQGGSLVRQKVGTVDHTFKFVCLEDTAIVAGLVYADQAITVTGSGAAAVARLAVGTNQARAVQRAVVVDNVDGDIIDRYVASVVDITFSGEITLAKNDDLRMYEFEAAVLAGGVFDRLTNSPGVTGTP